MELQEIERGLSLDTVARKWTAAYPFKSSPALLRDNYGQALSCLTGLERRLVKKQRLEEFNGVFADTVARGVFRRLSKEEKDSYRGPVNYISIVEAYKTGPHATTPLRLCLNSSMKYAGHSLNDLLMKGPSALNDLFGVSLGFRRHVVAISKDLSKFYQSVASVPRDQHLRRVLWREGDTTKEPGVYVTATVNFGDKPAGCVAQVAVRETARLYQHLDPAAAEAIIKSTYVDDSLCGADTLEAARTLSEGMDRLVALGGFAYKDTVMSGDPAVEGEERKVLGIRWDTAADQLAVDVKVNLSGRRKGLRLQPDLSLDALGDSLPAQVTRRMVWRVVLGQYDLLGLVSVFLVRMKLVMRDLSGEEISKAGWDAPIPPAVREEFLETLGHLAALRDLRFPRCIRPPGATATAKPSMVCFVDGSQSAFCTLVYARWEIGRGEFASRLVAGKTRVAPIKKVSVPRLELMGAVAGVRLAAKVQQHLGVDFHQRFFLTDSTAVLGMIRGESAAMQEFTGTRVSEVKTKSEPETEWWWVPTDQNLADMGTRRATTPGEMGLGSQYQLGTAWMRRPFEDWPVSQDLGAVPGEELVGVGVASVAVGETSLFTFVDYFTFTKVQRIVAYICQFLLAVKAKRRSAGQLGGGQEAGPPALSKEALDHAEAVLIWSAQPEVKKQLEDGKLAALMPRRLQQPTLLGGTREVIVTSGRGGELFNVGYGRSELPILGYRHSLSRRIMRFYHEIDHAAADRTVQRSREMVWIVRARALAISVRSSCFKCRLRARVLERQIMAPLPASRLPPSPIFDSTAVDLFGPLRIKDTVRGRVTGKCWGVLFCCTTTSAVHLEVTESYSLDSFLLCLRRFVSLRGTPSRFQSDPGDQLVAAAVQLGDWDFSRILEWAAGQRCEWRKIPANSQHFNGCAEAMIRVTKKQLTDILAKRTCTAGELATIFAEVARVVNSRPLMLRAGADPWSGGPITPLHLMGGRATIGVPAVQFQQKTSLTRRLQFIEETVAEFWAKWFAQVFSSLVPCYKWRQGYRDVMEGDIVILKEANPVQDGYRLARVKTAVPGADDRVRRLVLQYKLPQPGVDITAAGFKETERSVHQVAVIVPADWKAEDIEAEVAAGMELRTPF